MSDTIEIDFETVRFWLQINLVQRSIFDRVESELNQAGLPGLKSFDVLFALELIDEPTRARELEKLLAFQQSNLSRLLKKMFDSGYICETPDRKDGRSKLLTITSKGKKISRNIWQVYWPILEEMLQSQLGGADGVAAKRVVAQMPGAKEALRYF